jgi:RNase P subunit RPR2
MVRFKISEENWEIIEGFRLPVVYCPKCNSGLLGNSTHRIEPNGDVNASVVCPCGFHEFITLNEYSNNELK